VSGDNGGDDGGNELDLSAGERWIGIAGPVPSLEVMLSGVDESAQFSLVLS
jgi:hypothetical protein